MKKALIFFTIIVGVAAIIGGCKSSDDGAATTDTSTCTGTSSGSGPTIGSVTLEEATYLSSCFGGTSLKMEFKNNSSAQYTQYSSYSGDSCTGTASTVYISCLESITVSSTASTAKDTYLDGSLHGELTGYITTGTWKNGSGTAYMEFGTDNASVFWFNIASSQAKLESNGYFFRKFTKQ